MSKWKMWLICGSKLIESYHQKNLTPIYAYKKLEISHLKLQHVFIRKQIKLLKCFKWLLSIINISHTVSLKHSYHTKYIKSCFCLFGSHIFPIQIQPSIQDDSCNISSIVIWFDHNINFLVGIRVLWVTLWFPFSLWNSTKASLQTPTRICFFGKSDLLNAGLNRTTLIPDKNVMGNNRK